MTTVYTDVIDLVLFLSKCQFVTNNEVAVTKSWKISPALSLLLLCTILNQKSVKNFNFKLKLMLFSSLCEQIFRPIYQKKRESLTHKVYWHFLFKITHLLFLLLYKNLKISEKQKEECSKKRMKSMFGEQLSDVHKCHLTGEKQVDQKRISAPNQAARQKLICIPEGLLRYIPCIYRIFLLR